MKEYGIYIRNGQGSPYMLDKFKSIESVKAKLLEMIQLEEERGRPYFVDNDFWNNKYNIAIKLKYFRIIERDVTGWSSFTSDNFSKEKSHKIIYLNSFKNT